MQSRSRGVGRPCAHPLLAITAPFTPGPCYPCPRNRRVAEATAEVVNQGARLTAMLKRIELTNFKSFARQGVELAPFTLLVGPNASGKSNLLDALRFLQGTALD